MATCAASISNPTKGTFDDGVQLVTWSGLLNGDDGAPVELPSHADRSVQVTGTFGAAGNVNIEQLLEPDRGDQLGLAVAIRSAEQGTLRPPAAAALPVQPAAEIGRAHV